MVEQANLEVMHSGNHNCDFQDDYVRIDPYSLFLHAMKSPVTKKKYSRRLEMFFNFIKIPGGNIEEQCLTFVNSGKNDINWIFTNILKFVLFHKERIHKKEISGATLINYLKAIKLFCEMSDLSINWKITILSIFLVFTHLSIYTNNKSKKSSLSKKFLLIFSSLTFLISSVKDSIVMRIRFLNIFSAFVEIHASIEEPIYGIEFNNALELADCE